MAGVPVWALMVGKKRREESDRKRRYKEIESERQRGAELFEGALGPEALAKLRNERSPETAKLIRAALAQSGGFTAGENKDFRDQAISSTLSAQQSALRALGGAQAASGVRGALAVNQLGSVRAQGAEQLANFNRDLAVQNIAAKNQGLQTAANIITNQENIERDLGSDKLGAQLSTSGQRIALLGAEMQAKAAAASGKGGKGGGK